MGEIPSMLDRNSGPVLEPHRFGDFVDFFLFGSPLSSSHRHLSCGWAHSSDTHQVVGRTGQAHQLFISLDTPQPSFAQTADGLAQPKNCSIRLRTI
jgi:hypothetical protein